MTTVSDTLNVECPQWTENEFYIYDRFQFWIQIVTGFSVAFVGIVFNILAIIGLLSMRTRQNVFNYLLIYLLSADIMFLLCCIAFITFDHLVESDQILNQLTPQVLYPAYYITMTLSIYLTVAISHERFIAIQYPIVHSQKMKSAKSRRINLLKYLIIIICVTVGFHVPRFFEMEVGWKNSTHGEEVSQLPTQKYLRYFTRFGDDIVTEHRYY